MIRKGRFWLIGAICVAVVLGGGWSACPRDAADATDCAAAIANCADGRQSGCSGTPCEAASFEKQPPAQTCEISLNCVIRCATCVFAGARSNVNLSVDPLASIRLKPVLTSYVHSITTAPATRLAPFAVDAHRSPRAAQTLLGLHCALNL